VTDRDRHDSHDSHAGHTHGAALARAGERHRGRLLISFALIGGFFFVEAVAGFLTGSLALLSDAGHMLTDVVGLGMALAAIELASRSARRHDRADAGHTFGLYRLEILAAFVNAMLLFAVAIWVAIEAIRRLFDEPQITGIPMLIVAALGLLVNLIAFALLRSGSAESLNVRGAYLEVAADTISSAGVILAAALVAGFGWTWADPVVAMLIGLWILPRTWQLGRQAVRILLQAAPKHIDLAELTRDLAGIDGVRDVHDLHVWTLTSDMDAATAHLVVHPGTDHHAVLDQARQLLSATYHVDHGTFQIEPDDHEGCDMLDW
jgi:cobalt-zinc-cadmium efflux system protein